MIYRFYRLINPDLELGYYIEATEPLSDQDIEKLRWLIAETYEPEKTSTVQHIPERDSLEIGPRLTIETPSSSNRISVCKRINLKQVTRFEQTRRYRIGMDCPAEVIMANHFDRMTEDVLPGGISSFDTGIEPESVCIVDVLGRGMEAIDEINLELGLGLDDADKQYNYHLFAELLRRNPTNVEMFQLGNANSEHCRHWFWNGKQVIDNVEMPRTLMQIVKSPLRQLEQPNRTLKAFNDNSGVIRGFDTRVILPINPGQPSEMRIGNKVVHITCTAETHNHPTFVAPFPGAETGSGGRIRDNVAVGRGAMIGVGVAGYFVGNLFIPGYEIPGEVVGKNRPSQYASPLTILIEGSNGVSSYGNKIGEPLTVGWTRTFGQIVDNKWREPRKPILYSGGTGLIFDENLEKETQEVGMLIVRIGGLAYPVGEGGGAASSMIQGQNSEALDYNSVQRGNAKEENGTNRVFRACEEMGEDNPISFDQDQGAGGPSNAVTEAIAPLGGYINIRQIKLGDRTMSVLKVWSAEFQESYALGIRREKINTFVAICEREGVNCEILGEIDGIGKIVVYDDKEIVVDLNLQQILTDLPQKTFKSNRKAKNLPPLDLPDMTLGEAIEAVFKLPSVGSKGYLVHKVDRSVTGLVAQQQCCGIAQIPVADCGVNALSHFDTVGSAVAVGEQPIKMLIDPKAGARMSVAETLTNMAGTRITGIEDICFRANWMWPAKMPNEGALLYDAAEAMSDFIIKLGNAIDGGKDSLSMVATIQCEHVMAPGSLVMLGYAPVPDITKVVTPDIKRPGESFLVLIDLSGYKDENGRWRYKQRMGGSALAQACNQLGDETPDVDDPEMFIRAFNTVQEMIDKGLILAIHDKSDGGLITVVAEMCMASYAGFFVHDGFHTDSVKKLFNEEFGYVIEVGDENLEEMSNLCKSFDIPFQIIGHTNKTDHGLIHFDHARHSSWYGTITQLRKWWESTSHQIERLQKNPVCADEEYALLDDGLTAEDEPLAYHLTFTPRKTSSDALNATDNPRVAILREEGTNGDVEMRAACMAAGLSAWDVAMNDLLQGKADLDQFQGIIPAGGFSFMDVLDSAKGWAATILFNDRLRGMFERFFDRKDTFSLGVCNGFQANTLIGSIPYRGIASEKQPRLVQNLSRSFESRWVQVEVLPSPSILLQGMTGSKLGIWVAHGEGRLFFPDPSIEQEVISKNLAPLAYLNHDGMRTEGYLYNPNGSAHGFAALCSPDGRHLGMMPHPERCFRLWQLPWSPDSFHDLEAAPWLRMFQNARTWCMEHR